MKGACEEDSEGLGGYDNHLLQADIHTNLLHIEPKLFKCGVFNRVERRDALSLSFTG